MAILFSLLIFIFASGASAAPEVPILPEVKTYDQLVSAIREARSASRARIEQAVEQEKVREAWEIGKLIQEHILLNKERADYGEQILLKLAKDLETSETELRYMLQFARAYPIHPAPDELSWAHYRELLSVNDPEKREEIAKEAVRNNWSQKELREEIKKSRAAMRDFSDNKPLTSLKGELDTYRIVMLEGRPVINLGFSNYLELSRKDAKRFKEGDIIRVSRGKLKLVKGATESLVPFQMFSYRATVLDVTDGDTFWALVDLGFGFTTKQHLRLRGLDAPEAESADGHEAKEYLEKILKISSPVLIKTSKSDKYDRYLVDVWVGETYVNQTLLDEGLATRVSD